MNFIEVSSFLTGVFNLIQNGIFQKYLDETGTPSYPSSHRSKIDFSGKFPGVAAQGVPFIHSLTSQLFGDHVPALAT